MVEKMVKRSEGVAKSGKNSLRSNNQEAKTVLKTRAG
jgi:hypothetical protein